MSHSTHNKEISMSKWSPNAQLASLQFSGIVSFIIALQFLHFIGLNIIDAISPSHPILQSFVFENFKFVPLILGGFFLLRYIFTLKQLNTATNWHSVLMILKDEYALSIYRVAASKSFTTTISLCFVLFYITVLEMGPPAMTALLNAETVLATLIFISSVVFGCIVLFHLHDEDA